jgi:hypothetical protein
LANGDNNGGARTGETQFEPGPAAESVISLSQAILAPLDALAKAQVHAARSFLNLVLQIGYPHAPVDENGHSQITAEDVSYSSKFRIDSVPGQIVEISVPTLALVPLQPLGIESADFNLELVIREVAYHQQMQESEKAVLKEEPKPEDDSRRPHARRPWYLVTDPISLRGTISDPGGGDTQKLASIKMNVKLSRLPTPAGLQKLLTAMTQHSGIRTNPPTPNDTNAGG